MPYELKKVKGGWKVQKKGGVTTSAGRRYFSDSPLPRERAVDQMRALYASEGRTSPRRTTKSPTRKKKPTSPRRTTKSPTRKKKPTSPRRLRKRLKSPTPKKRHASPKYKRK